MTTPILTKRLSALEAVRAATPAQLTAGERAEAARRYEAAIHTPEEADTRAIDYWSTATVHQLAADYDAMLKGAFAPWMHLGPRATMDQLRRSVRSSGIGEEEARPCGASEPFGHGKAGTEEQAAQ